MTAILKQYTLNFFDPACNSNKVWIGTAFEDGAFETKFGRVRDGANLAAKRKTFSSSTAALAELERKTGEKLRKGYRETPVLNNSENTVIFTKNEPHSLGQIAVEEILGADAATEDATTAELIKYLATINIHQITNSTSIKYNAAAGTFSTPLGVLTPQAITDARNLLSSIRRANAGTLRGNLRHTLVCDYFRLVPSDFGVKIPQSEKLLDTVDKIDKQNSILDALDAALESSAPVKNSEKLFACRLRKIPHWTEDGKSKFREIKTLFEKTRNSGHATHNLKLTRIYEVEISRMKSNFDETAKKLGNVRADLWHGTKASNLLSIMKNGLIIPPSSAAHCTGRMFGNGIYTSLQSTKALNYATNMWNRSGAMNQKTFMFLTEAALGAVYKPKSSGGGNFPFKGTDSTWVEPGTAGVINHECVVYSTAQINLRYLCEFGAV